MSNKNHRSIWLDDEDPDQVCIIDQRFLPFEWKVETLRTVEDAARAIREMHVRGAPLIGVTAAFGLYLAALRNSSDRALNEAAELLKQTRPTAVDLFHAIDRCLPALLSLPPGPFRSDKAVMLAQWMAQESVQYCRAIGEHGLPLIRAISKKKKGEPVNILTHCNAGWLACIEYGTATAPIYLAHAAGLPVHVWVDETRPRNQGARLTAYELGQKGIPHTIIADNAGGQLMRQGRVDLVLVGSDRTARNGDVANKIGTYLKALAAFDNTIPFYVALPSSSIDRRIRDGKDIPIEERSPAEVLRIEGWDGEGLREVQLAPEGSPALNIGFDVTPARLVSGLITERGLCEASEKGIESLFPEWKL